MTGREMVEDVDAEMMYLCEDRPSSIVFEFWECRRLLLQRGNLNEKRGRFFVQIECLRMGEVVRLPRVLR